MALLILFLLRQVQKILSKSPKKSERKLIIRFRNPAAPDYFFRFAKKRKRVKIASGTYRIVF